MRVLVLNQYFPPDPCATGQLGFDLAAALSAEGHEVHALCSRGLYGGGRSAAAPYAREDGVHLHRLPAPALGRDSLTSRALDCAGLFAPMLARALRLGPFDVCVALTMPPFVGAIGAALRARHGTRLLLWTMDLFEGVVPRTRGAARWLYRRADHVVTLSSAMARRAVAGGADPARLSIIPNWMPGEPRRPPDGRRLRAEWGLGDAPLALYSGNHGRGHELTTLVRALARADARALFVGGGERRALVEELCGDLDVDATFRPPQPLGRVTEVLGAGDLHLVGQGPNRLGVSEPCKLAAAFACGRPVVHVGPPASHSAELARAAGVSVVCGDVQGAAAAIRELLGDASLRRRMGEAARALYDAELSRARGTARLIERVCALASAPAAPGPSAARRPAG